MNTDNIHLNIALVDDHRLVREAIAGMISQREGFKVTIEASNGQELVAALEHGRTADLVLLDLSMPVMDGWQTAKWLHENHPEIMVLMLTIFESDVSIIKLLQWGVRGFVRKDSEKRQLHQAIESVATTGYYRNNNTARKIINMVRDQAEGNSYAKARKPMGEISDLHIQFLNWACTDLTYKEIADKLGVNPRKIDSLRDDLFQAWSVSNRVGLAIEAIRLGIVRVI